MMDAYYELNVELDYLRSSVRHVLNNINDISKRKDVIATLEVVANRLDELCEATNPEGESE